jgi:hypothetical protein
MTKMPVVTKRDGSRELQWLAAWGATRTVEKNEDDVAIRCRPRCVGVDVAVRRSDQR